jgi:Zn-dependent protease with chaperone function
MQFEPRKPAEGINVSKEHPLVEAGTLVIGLSIIFALIAIALVFIVEIALYFVPAEKEAAMFRNWLPEDIATVSPNDERLERLDNVLWRLTQHYPESPYEFRIEIDDSELMNAMALPGGLIIVTSGLLERVESENELAFILGHELGHFSNRDHLRALGRAVVIGVMFTAISGSGGGDFGVTVADLALRGFSRGQESSADEFGLQIVHDEYGHVADSWRFFERINEEDGDAGVIELLTYLSTHPSPDDRVEDLIEQAGRNGWSISGEIRPIAWEAETVAD